mgnify:CR=1 FL=1
MKKDLNKEKVFMQKIEKGEFHFSYSSLNRLMFSPSLFYKDYILKDREVRTDKHLIAGKLIHLLLLQPEDLEHDDQSNLKLEVVDRKFRGTNFIYTLKTNSDLLIPVFVHSHHMHQHEIDEKFGIKRPINIDHIVCF